MLTEAELDALEPKVRQKLHYSRAKPSYGGSEAIFWLGIVRPLIRGEKLINSYAACFVLSSAAVNTITTPIARVWLFNDTSRILANRYRHEIC